MEKSLKKKKNIRINSRERIVKKAVAKQRQRSIFRVRKYKPRCPCGVNMKNGKCPEGCDPFRKPSRFNFKVKKRKGDENGTYLTPKEVEDGMATALRKMSRWTF